MAEMNVQVPNVQVPMVGGQVRATTLGMCISLWVVSAVFSIFAEITFVVVRIDFSNLSKLDVAQYKTINISLWLVCVAIMANVLAVIVQHTYIFITLGPRNLFTRENPFAIRWHGVILEVALWASFIATDSILLIGANFFWRTVHNAGRPFLIYRTGMYLAAGNLTFFAIFVTLGLHNYVIGLHDVAPEENRAHPVLDVAEENRVRSVLAATHELPLSVVTQVDEDDMCSICHETPTSGEMLRELPCHHLFHPQCIDEWLIRSPVCPLCKREVF